MAKNKPPEKRTFILKVTTTGLATVTVEATDEADARRALMAGEGTDGPHEWEYDEVRSVSEDK